ncbi:MAG: MOSC domain-containing protein [Gammaproteobacteria bacterium]
MSELQLSAIYIYPVKSCAGIAVRQWEVVAKGLRYDRQWMLIDAENRFLSQRKLPRMALIKPEINVDNMILRAPGMPPLILPPELSDGGTVETHIWGDVCKAVLAGKEADQWGSDFLHSDCRLVCQPEESVRAVDPAYGRLEDNVFFSDGFPFLIISESSLAALNRAMHLELPMARFRPNLVVSGCEAYAEDYWRRIAIGAIDFRLPKPCSRCAVPTIDPDTAETGKEPLATLNRLRKLDNKVYFGQNALHDQCGVLRVGDRVEIRETGPAQPLLAER